MHSDYMTGQSARLRIWDNYPTGCADTLQGLLLGFCNAPTVLDSYGGFSKLISRKTYLRLRWYFSSAAPDFALVDGDWRTLKELVFYVLDSSQGYCGHYVLRNYLDASDSMLYWLDTAPEYLPLPQGLPI